ncbi:hypothetical protein Scep_025607 [Stephania cephalantha]|uniref:Uncharacterized protein n=1 Tax=Stephania cephalantha TaxID=152367 RepID=A0AAP0HMG5_9MAGN
MYSISFELACLIDVESCPFLGILTLMSVQGQVSRTRVSIGVVLGSQPGP